MKVYTPAEFLKEFCLPVPVHDHHLTGPPSSQRLAEDGAVFHCEGEILAGLSALHGGPVLELGADHGVSTRYIHEGLDLGEAHPGQCILSIDVYHKWDDDSDWPRRRRIVHDSSTYSLPFPCTWAFIDGDHRYPGVLADIKTCLSAGIRRLLFHDTALHLKRNPLSTSDGSDAREAVLDFFSARPTWDLIEIGSPAGLIYAYHLTY